MADNPVFVFVGVYSSEQIAQEDYETLKDMATAGLVGSYDAAIVLKQDGQVHVHKHEKPTQHGAWTGLGVGALVGILFPPSLIASCAVGASAGGVVGHLWRGMSRGDVKELGTMLDEGEAALVVIGSSLIEKRVREAMARAERQLSKELQAESEQLERELEAASA
ncbi:MAG TPA: DUF1269 domain-containing protein [Solirubrobacteraceae bacterium]|nr:DUF1269 domain-containing protein [Solirubrobacteraceae bacterium]